jgi:RNA polymerase sigma factor (sigma-70 family)
MDEPTNSPDDSAQTTLHVRAAVRGVPDSVAWIVQRFSPLLLEQARYRLRRVLKGRYDAEDLVQQVWAISLPRLADLVPRHGRYTPVLLRFLANTLLRHYGNLVEKHLAGHGVEIDVDGDGSAGLDRIPASTTEVLTRVMRSEEAARLTESLRRIDDDEREILVLRGIEQLPYAVIARRLQCSEEAARTRYARALKRLRGILPAVVSAELGPA